MRFQSLQEDSNLGVGLRLAFVRPRFQSLQEDSNLGNDGRFYYQSDLFPILTGRF